MMMIFKQPSRSCARQLVEIQERESSAMINKPQTVRKIIFKFGGSKTVLLHKHDDIEKDSCSETLMCKRQKINNNNGGMRLMIKKSEEGVIDFIKSVGGSEAEFVIEKGLMISDVTPNHGRLLIPVLQVENQGFLTADEETMMGKKDVSVWVFDPERRKSTSNLAKWRMSKECYVSCAIHAQQLGTWLCYWPMLVSYSSSSVLLVVLFVCLE
ncbi:putative DNA-binding pseudobarrel domain superfamily [Helianthus annuus]|uniref:DNA-binding pseudobarrel domain superfamily n=1 Tax=Helianthus annuus TaxID=4232 RepID=A0A9K3J6Q0_HELAN|nr:putative DNA-binding pseudobarrel domain superfamily [Helianthus annuus]KAJ0580412.1 putative DNA-binding pseudobarrel domain superfamily [Helianthus annuus]KAJ0596370.1 putative DNA-binding pseudobarrel domain superfamily [Helianthus annuus]KAJ0926096.1 putative DNA-binding pseudobarrel domain superfamily [Helianthus annuus]